MIKLDFESLWVQVETILLNIARCVSGDEEQLTKVKITELKEKMLDVSDREKKIIKAFEICYKEEISALQEKSDSNKKSIDNLQVDVTGVQKDVTWIQKDVTGVQKDVTGIQKDVTGIQKDINRLHDVVCCRNNNVCIIICNIHFKVNVNKVLHSSLLYLCF